MYKKKTKKPNALTLNKKKRFPTPNVKSYPNKPWYDQDCIEAKKTK